MRREAPDRRVVAQHGKLHIFFANAGISGGLASITQQTAEDWTETSASTSSGRPRDQACDAGHGAPWVGVSIVLHGKRRGASRGAGGAALLGAKAGVIQLCSAAQQFAAAASASTRSAPA